MLLLGIVFYIKNVILLGSTTKKHAKSPYNPHITHYSSFHFIFHYPYITPYITHFITPPKSSMHIWPRTSKQELQNWSQERVEELVT